MCHGEAHFLAFGRNNLTPRRHVDMFHKRAHQTPIHIKTESKTVHCEALAPIFETVFVTLCHLVMEIVIFVTHTNKE
jgi:hypothetical protein